MVRFIVDDGHETSEQGDVDMICARCAGYMVEDEILDIDIESSEGNRILSAWRCLNCGAFIERLMDQSVGGGMSA